MNGPFKFMKRGYRLLVDRHYKKNDLIHNRYKIESFIGIGSYGMTYLCRDSKEDNLCVLKQMTKSKRRQEISRVYQKETDILGKLHHPRIPSLLEKFTIDKHDFYTMELIDGENLEEILFYEKGKFNETKCLEMFKELVEITSYIHSKEVVHGDIRIPNVIMKDSALYLIDFGLAEELGNCSRNDKVALLREDYYDLGDFLLFLLYSTYHSSIKRGRSWMEELEIHPKTSHLLKRLLGIEQPYSDTAEVMEDVVQVLNYL
ncbi:serine/threonine protein kinase [Aquibacillus kalidii]|uniref:serine/threonine protein kinase n=1 Tax=Aquibacillus kalidii TaxID=2762597 RepID=UPI00164816DD|nr:protein kinase [Aquibacillus kalidii]